MEIVIKRVERPRLNLAEIWAYRELFYLLAWRDFKVRYKQTAIGASWVVFQPLFTMVVFTIFFNKLLGVKSPGGNYEVFVIVGLVYWNLFASSLQNASNSLVANQGLITKVYFPRLIAPLATMLVYVVDFAVASLVLVGVMAFYGVRPGLLGIALAFPMLLVTLLFAGGLGTFFAAVNVRYRDVKFAVPFLVQTLLFVTPVIYAVNLIPSSFRMVTYINPMAGVVTAMRAELVHQGSVSWIGVAISSIAACLAAYLGTRYFIRGERRFADIA
ncbi:MAG TPA: ABC transporter permease [Gaiellaceae bacterium]|nr:ABC transporter permease [Gaiellaceae bacterium]